MQNYTRKISTYSVVGATATATYVVTSSLCGDILGITPQIASGIGVGCATVISYLGHKHFSFKFKGDDWATYRRFCIQVIVTYIINFLLVAIITEYYLQPLWLSTSYATAIVIVINFFIYDNYTFAKR
jgi:putative flippase GtrA